jgi:hypothetical protein
MTGWLAVPLRVCGQVDYVEEKTRINAIKTDTRYIYGEGIADTPEDALMMAEQNLETEVRLFVSKNLPLQDAKSAETVAGNIKKKSQQIKLKRGSMERVFLYVATENISSGDQVKEIALPDGDSTERMEPVETETQKETLEPAKTETQTEIPDPAETEKQTATETVEPEPVAAAPSSLPPAISEILATSGMASLQTCLKQQKDAHRIMWGRVTSEINPAWYIIAIADDKIRAVFDKGLNIRTNFLTGKKEDVNDCRSCIKIWLTVHE